MSNLENASKALFASLICLTMLVSGVFGFVSIHIFQSSSAIKQIPIVEVNEKESTVQSASLADSNTPKFPPLSDELNGDLTDPRDPGSKTVITSKNNPVDSIDVERHVLKEINEYRSANGLKQWSYSYILSSTSRGHSYDMAQRNFFGHTNPSGEEPWDRLESDRCRKSYGENIVKTYLGQPTTAPNESMETYYTEKELGKAIVEYWKNSPPHNKLLLSKGRQAAGVGVYFEETENGFIVYGTLNVCNTSVDPMTNN